MKHSILIAVFLSIFLTGCSPEEPAPIIGYPLSYVLPDSMKAEHAPVNDPFMLSERVDLSPTCADYNFAEEYIFMADIEEIEKQGIDPRDFAWRVYVFQNNSKKNLEEVQEDFDTCMQGLNYWPLEVSDAHIAVSALCEGVMLGCATAQDEVKDSLELSVEQIPSEKMPAQDNLATYENSLYSLAYPSTWDTQEEQHGTGGPATGIRTDFYNLSVDSPACPDEMINIAIDTGGWWDAGFFNGFDTMVKSEEMYAGMDSQLGKWSGELVKTTIGGKKAYQVDSLGWEVGCVTKDYIVETNKEGHYMTIEVSSGTAAVNEEVVRKMLDSIQFKK